jgi:sulfonate transport system substrate-binding protein
MFMTYLSLPLVPFFNWVFSLHRIALITVMAVLAFCATGVSAQTYFDRYGLSPASAAVDLGVQPLGYPSGVISAVMLRDQRLKKALADNQHPLKAHPFQRGADMLDLLADHRLEAGLLGDMPTILAASTGGVWIVGLVKQTSTAIVTKGDVQVGGLAGKRIGYVAASSAHHTLLQGLASAGLTESQVKLVAMGVDDMPDALERGAIDAFAAWEPAPSLALANSHRNRIVFQGLSSDYFVIDRDFERRAPQAAKYLIAGFLRAIEWMRRSPRNAEKAAAWAKADHELFAGKPVLLPISRIVAIAQKEILSIPSAPAILRTSGALPLQAEFKFLTDLGKLPAGGSWSNVEASFSYEGLAQVMADGRTYQTTMFEYAD